MDAAQFRQSIAGVSPPAGLGAPLAALWHEAKGDWHRAHGIAQSRKCRAAAAVHAYLHRREGDLANADYWYRRAGRERPRGALDREWESLVAELLDDMKGKR